MAAAPSGPLRRPCGVAAAWRPPRAPAPRCRHYHAPALPGAGGLRHELGRMAATRSRHHQVGYSAGYGNDDAAGVGLIAPDVV